MVGQSAAVPALLEIGREMIAGEAREDVLRETEEALIADAMRVE
jgi:ATP-dependent Lhr-like helicase